MNNNIDFEQINNLANQINLVEYVGSKYDLKQNGINYYCKCPRHKDFTPSLCINSEENYFRCFSCTITGNALTFMTKVEKMSFQDAINKISEITGTEIKMLKRCEALDFFKTLKKCHDNSNKIVTNDREILPWSYYEQFDDEIPEEWVNEDMSPKILKEYDIRIDKKSNRIVYPIFDNNDNLIGAKGRSRFSGFKELGIAKYMNYKKIGNWDFWVGLKYNREEILKKSSVVIFEGIKSGLKLASLCGNRAWLAAETSCINDDEIRILIGMGIKDITIAFDSDVTEDKIFKCTALLKKFANVYYIKDKHHLLGEKESPIDRGIEVYNKLFESRVPIK